MPDTMKYGWLRFRRFLQKDKGQTTVEYALLCFLTVTACVGAFKALETAVTYYYYDVVSLICLPIP